MLAKRNGEKLAGADPKTDFSPPAVSAWLTLQVQPAR